MGTPPPRVREGLASVAEATSYLRLSRTTLYKLMSDGRLPYTQIGRSRRIPWRAIDDLIHSHTVPAKS